MATKQVIGSLTANDETAQREAGTMYIDPVTGKGYRYILIEDLAVAVGDVVEFSDTSGNEVTQDRAGGSSIGRVVAGVALGTITDGYYGWIQVSGRNATIKTDGGVGAAEGLVPHATQNGHADSAIATSTGVNTEGQIFAHALEADDSSASGATCAGVIKLL